MTQINTERVEDAASDVYADIVKQLPALPSVIRYYDDFDDQIRSISQPHTAVEFVIFNHGSKLRVNFQTIDRNRATLTKHAFAFAVSSNVLGVSAGAYIYAGASIPDELLIEILASDPSNVIAPWTRLLASDIAHHAFDFVKLCLKLLCAYGINGWSDSYLQRVRALPYPAVDKYASLRSGEAFLPPSEEAKIIRYLDQVSQDLKFGCDELQKIEDAALLACSYQFGMRAVQLAMLRLEDIKVISETSGHSVHLKFRMAKQRTGASSVPLVRKVKFEWTPIFVALFESHQLSGAKLSTRFFNKGSSKLVQTCIGGLTEKLTGARVGVTSLRHAAAQRLVDAGASQEELAAFLGHSYRTTGLVYFDSSPNQAEIINRALGASEIFSRVSRALHDKFISPSELLELKGEQQIAGVPHGIPIIGIGGCASGQPTCPFNPIMSCYGCRKFMPVNNIETHEKVLEGLRSVVSSFAKASRDETSSPAYQQLNGTIDDVKSVISELTGGDQ